MCVFRHACMYELLPTCACARREPLSTSGFGVSSLRLKLENLKAEELHGVMMINMERIRTMSITKGRILIMIISQ